MPYGGVHYLWFVFVCLLIRSYRPLRGQARHVRVTRHARGATTEPAPEPPPPPPVFTPSQQSRGNGGGVRPPSLTRLFAGQTQHGTGDRTGGGGVCGVGAGERSSEPLFQTPQGSMVGGLRAQLYVAQVVPLSPRTRPHTGPRYLLLTSASVRSGGCRQSAWPSDRTGAKFSLVVPRVSMGRMVTTGANGNTVFFQCDLLTQYEAHSSCTACKHLLHVHRWH